MQTLRQFVPSVQLREEDREFFASDIMQISIKLVPHIRQTRRGDILITGFVQENSAIDVVFSGHRASLALPLVSKLRAQLAQRHRVSPDTEDEPDVMTLRQSARIEGSWRRRFTRDTHGWQTHQHQFYAARWMVLDAAGKPVTYGASVRS